MILIKKGEKMKIIIEVERKEKYDLNSKITIATLDGDFNFNYKIKKGLILWFFYHVKLEKRFWNDLACSSFMPLNEKRLFCYEVFF